MVRAQFYLPNNLYEEIKRTARADSQSFAELARDLLSSELARRRSNKPKLGISSLGKLGVRGGPKDLAINLDYYMYGSDKSTKS
jgi:hypothetical protein